jgi:hypothetical protein
MHAHPTTTMATETTKASTFTAKSSDIAACTQSYRQEILDLARQSNTEIAWTVSKHVLDMLWSLQQTRGQNLVMTNSASSCGVSYYYYGCQYCGSILHPGYGGSHIRAKNPKKLKMDVAQDGTAASRKTLKRREQRKKQRAARNKQAQPKKLINSANDSKSAPRTSENRLILLDDATDVNRMIETHLVLTCGRCHGKTVLKGPKKLSGGNEKKQTTPKQPSGKGNIRKDFSRTLGQSNNSRKRKSFEDAKTTATGKLDDSFVSLPPAKINDFSTKASLSLIEQRLASKKKKKKSKTDTRALAGGKSNLMNFLSSLNDH